MKKAMAWVLVILDVLLLPLAVSTVMEWLGIPGKWMPLKGYFALAAAGVFFLRCFFIPYIAAGTAIPVLMFYHIKEWREGRMKPREFFRPAFCL